MSFDYSKLSDEDLEALAKEDYSKMSDEALQLIANYKEPKKETPKEETGYSAGPIEKIVDYAAPAIGAVQAAYETAPVATTAAGTALASGAAKLASKIPGVTPAATAVYKAVVPAPIQGGISAVKGVAEGLKTWGESQAAQTAQRANTTALNQYNKIAARVAADQAAGRAVLASDQKILDLLAQEVQSGRAPAPVAQQAGQQAGQQAAQQATKQAGRFSQLAQRLAPALQATGATSTLLAPYQMAAYEQEKIRENPYSPEYAVNPYAMSYRSQKTDQPITQGQAGAMNRRATVANQQYGGLTAHEQEVLRKDHENRANRLKLLIQEAAAKKALVDPTLSQ